MKQTAMWCHKDVSDRPYCDFSSTEHHCRVGYGDSLPIVKVTVREAGPADKDKPEYWSFWEEKDDNGNPIVPGAFAPCFTWPARSMVEMCFTYGSKAHAERHGGGLMRVVIEEVA
jgi:hypothetical protein